MGKLLLVEDEEDLRFAIARFLSRRGFQVIEAGRLSEAAEKFLEARPEVVVVDYRLPDGDGLALLRTLRRHEPGLAAIVLTGEATIQLAVESIKEGAQQFLAKPVELDTLATMARRLADSRKAERVYQASQQRDRRQEVDPFVGTSAAIERLKEEAFQVAAVPVSVLIQGETGTGKGVLARWLHQNGPRRDEPWVDLNCAGLSRQLLESELFGHQKGAFTGAVTAKPGLLEVAHRGSLFLDEIGDMSPEVQPRLLKVLEEKTFRRLGDVRQRRAEVRLMAATHHDLEARSQTGHFRLDLLYRINTVRLVVPPLRQRRQDIVQLARSLSRSLAQELGCSAPELEPEAEEKLLEHSWPGNVRELRNVIERTLLFGRIRSIGADEVERAIGNGGGAQPGSEATAGLASGPVPSLVEAEKRHIQNTLRRFSGDVREAARVLEISRSGLYKKLQRHGLSPQQA
ncbi:MAG: sigma-54 dependent transcriptional regulator [Acidobacteriota bacterium]